MDVFKVQCDAEDQLVRSTHYMCDKPRDTATNLQMGAGGASGERFFFLVEEKFSLKFYDSR